MITVAQMRKRKDVRVLYRILSFLGAFVTIPFFLLSYIGEISGDLAYFIQRIGVRPVRWYIKVRRINKYGEIE